MRSALHANVLAISDLVLRLDYSWLDHGEGKETSLPECSREQLEKERITYLSAEQRLKCVQLPLTSPLPV